MTKKKVIRKFLPEKIEIVWKFHWKNQNFYPDPRLPRFQTRLTPLAYLMSARLKQSVILRLDVARSFLLLKSNPATPLITKL